MSLLGWVTIILWSIVFFSYQPQEIRGREEEQQQQQCKLVPWPFLHIRAFQILNESIVTREKNFSKIRLSLKSQGFHSNLTRSSVWALYDRLNNLSQELQTQLPPETILEFEITDGQTRGSHSFRVRHLFFLGVYSKTIKRFVSNLRQQRRTPDIPLSPWRTINEQIIHNLKLEFNIKYWRPMILVNLASKKNNDSQLTIEKVSQIVLTSQRTWSWQIIRKTNNVSSLNLEVKPGRNNDNIYSNIQLRKHARKFCQNVFQYQFFFKKYSFIQFQVKSKCGFYQSSAIKTGHGWRTHYCYPVLMNVLSSYFSDDHGFQGRAEAYGYFPVIRFHDPSFRIFITQIPPPPKPIYNSNCKFGNLGYCGGTNPNKGGGFR